MKNLQTLTNDKSPKEQLKELVQFVSRVEIMDFAKNIGIQWTYNENSNINWMRCSMALQQNFELFYKSWNEHLNLQVECAKEIAASVEDFTEDKSPEWLYCSGDFQPNELLVYAKPDALKNLEVGSELEFWGEYVQIAQILNENNHEQYLFNYKNKLVSLNKLELYNKTLIEAYLETKGFHKTYLSRLKHGTGHPLPIWKRHKCTFEEKLDLFYVNTKLFYELGNNVINFTKTPDGWRYLSFHGRLHWFSNSEILYIHSKLKLNKCQMP